MFYRLFTPMTLSRRLLLDVTNPFSQPGIIHANEFENLFEEIPMEKCNDHCRLYKAPCLPQQKIHRDIVIKKFSRGEFPDIWTRGETALVSEKLKSVIERCDDFTHQFWPVTIVDKKGNQFCDQQYYLLNIRRFVRVRDCGKPHETVDFYEMNIERDYLPTIQHYPDLREQIEKLPIWRHARNNEVIYLNEYMVSQLKLAGINGINEYTRPLGRAEEALGHV